jgi:hypothetical protein
MLNVFLLVLLHYSVLQPVLAQVLLAHELCRMLNVIQQTLNAELV